VSAQVVWFKRDLRADDHEPLAQALQAGRTHCIYILEPELWQQADAARQHYHFVQECLRDLYAELRRHGLRLHIYVGQAVEVLRDIHAQHGMSALFSHEETGNAWTYARDLAVKAWCAQQHIAWHESPQFGVIRGLRHRAKWQSAWNALMQQPLCHPFDGVEAQDAGVPWVKPALPSADELGLPQQEPHDRQRGGRRIALEVLDSFLNERSRRYRGGISSPRIAPDACSRLSPYLSMGCISLREVVQHTRAQMKQTSGAQSKGLAAFQSRLYWHCHFVQKLESEPSIEWQNMHRGYDGLRESDFNLAHFEALQEARTGWPMVDACVRMLDATGWLNFRMRAMLVSVAAYPLWLHWRPVGEWLARSFLDYEPGIHWSQLQMQSGTTGINTTRVYNPIKQAMDHDPEGHFVRHWIPAMRNVPDVWLFEPWLMPPSVQAECGVVVGRDIPAPLVDLNSALRVAKQRLHERRNDERVRQGKRQVLATHVAPKPSTTRKRSNRASGAKPAWSAAAQMPLLDE